MKADGCCLYHVLGINPGRESSQGEHVHPVHEFRCFEKRQGFCLVHKQYVQRLMETSKTMFNCFPNLEVEITQDVISIIVALTPIQNFWGPRNNQARAAERSKI